MPLEAYRTKRDFTRTPEPAPGPPPGTPAGGRGRFMVHRHRATRLHYDLRLEIGGALASWAVPQGPSRDPAVKRLAVHVEDHPIEYLDFEGVIPKGEYGAGDSICWDWGTFQAEETWDPAAAVEGGELKFRLWGEKLAGRWTLVHTGGRSARSAAGHGSRAGADWLLIAKRGPDAIEGWDPEAFPASVKSGLTGEEVAAGLAPRLAGSPPAPLATLDPPGSRPEPQPAFVGPMLAMPGAGPFDDPGWLFEPKWDGYRVQAIVTGDRVALRTRSGNDAAAYFPGFLPDARWLAAPEAVIDGEVVALDASGRPDFSLLRGLAPEAARSLVFAAFDLPWCAGRSYLDVALEDRKEVLRLVLRDDPRVRFTSHVVGTGIAFHAAVAAQGLEGSMAKRRRSVYARGRRSPDWLKLKLRPTQELVVGGYVAGRGSHHELGALVVGVMEGGRLRYAGRVGSGMDATTRRQLKARLDAHSRQAHPFESAPAALAGTAGATWTEPSLVIRAALGGWTGGGLVRQASFDSLAPEVDPRSVERQVAVAPAAAAADAPGSDDPEAPATVRTRTRTAVVRQARSTAPASAAGPDRAASLVPPTPDELAALDALPARGGLWTLGGRTVTLTHLDRALAPGRDDEPPIEKRDLIRYFATIAPVMLPHLADRALNVVRFPAGIGKPSFWQRDVGREGPSWITRWREPDPPDRQAHTYVVADSAATLAWLGNMGAVELHPWTSRTDRPGEPRWALVDIDPGTATTWEETLVLARLYRRAFDHLGVVGAPKVTGKRGIQILVPVRAGYTFEETRDWVERISRAVGAAVPELVSWEWSKDRRDGRARLDFTQNWGNRTLVAAYSPRPAPGLPVSAPIAWDELDDPDLRPDRWTIRTIADRVASRGDLFAPALGEGQALPAL